MVYTKEEVIQKGQKYLKRKSRLLLFWTIFPIVATSLLYLRAFIFATEEDLKNLGTAGVIGVIVTFIFVGILPSILFLVLYIQHRKRYSDPLMVGCIVCRDEVRSQHTFDANALYYKLQEKDKAYCADTTHSKARPQHRKPVALIIILTVFYSCLWFSLLFIIVGFFMPNPVRFFKKLNGTYVSPSSVSTSKYGLSDDPGLDEVMFYDTVIDDD